MSDAMSILELQRRACPLDEPTVHDVEMRMVISCPCNPTQPIILKSIAAGGTCAVCQRTFFIGMMHFDRREADGVSFAVGVQQPTIVRPS